MSAYLCSNDTLNALTTYWAFKTTEGLDDLYSSLNRIHHQIMDDDRAHAYLKYITNLRAVGRDERDITFQLLLDENIKSLQARYPSKWDTWDSSTYFYKSSPSVKRWILTNKTGLLVGIVNNYTYQSCEHDSWQDSPGYLLVEGIRGHLLQDFRRSCIDDPSERIWDFTEPNPVS